MEPDHEEMRIERAIELLRRLGAHRARHSGGFLLDHLEGVFKLLKEWRVRPAVQHAGLFHSIYGTEFYKRTLVSSDARAVVASVIGTESEPLAYLFGRIVRSSLYAAAQAGTPYVVSDRFSPDLAIELDEGQVVDLLHIGLANWLEQAGRMAGLGLPLAPEPFGGCKHLLCPLASSALNAISVFRSQVASA